MFECQSKVKQYQAAFPFVTVPALSAISMQPDKQIAYVV